LLQRLVPGVLQRYALRGRKGVHQRHVQRRIVRFLRCLRRHYLRRRRRGVLQRYMLLARGMLLGHGLHGRPGELWRNGDLVRLLRRCNRVQQPARLRLVEQHMQRRGPHRLQRDANPVQLLRLPLGRRFRHLRRKCRRLRHALRLRQSQLLPLRLRVPRMRRLGHAVCMQRLPLRHPGRLLVVPGQRRHL
jgi:hypothetical protein